MNESSATTDASLPEPSPPGRTHDPEFDVPGPRAPTNRFDLHWPQGYQRLVANPFLALLAFIGWCYAFWHGLLLRSFPLAAVLFASLVGVLFLLHYHCLDCGATGWLFRWRSHVCEQVLARQHAGRRRRFRGPNPVTQAILWGYAFVIAAILAWIIMGS
jgi:hypothetical protein